MTLSAVFRWKNADSTRDLNRRLQTLVPRGIFDGGEVTSGAGLTVNVSPGIAIGYDGMLVQDDAVQVLGVVANSTNYIVVRAKYVSGTTPTVQWEVMNQAAYNADPDKNYLIVYAVVTLAAGATSVASADISTLARDTVDPLTRSPYRGNTVFASLPTHPPIQNRDGDFYFLTDLGTFYWWNASTASWDAFTTGSYNVETGGMANTIIQGERDRQLNGSGVLGGKRPADGFASELDIEIVETPSVAAQVGFNTFSATVNGHYVQPYARYVTLPAKGARHDLIFLEVYREAITVPENHDFPRNPDGTATYTISQVSDQVEQMLCQAGVGGNNFDLNELQPDDHLWTVTKYRIGVVQNVGTAALADNQASASLAQNVDGNFFSAPSGVAPGTDERTWIAASTTAKDGFSWAIPLFVVKRTVAEDHTVPAGAVKIFRDDVRYVFPVYPVADSGQAARLSIDTIAREQPFNYATETQVDYTKPSGFINGLDYEIVTSGVSKEIKFYSDEIRFRIRGLEDVLRFTGGPGFALPAAPAIGYERNLVYLKMSYTMYSNDPTQEYTMISDRHRPLITDQVVVGYPFKGIGWKRGYVTYEVVCYNLGAATRDLDEHDSMTSAGWTKGDVSMAALGQQYSDGGIWSKSASVATDERVPIFSREWAIPICLVHRLNAAAWSWDTNPNGSGVGRPDGKPDPNIIHQDEILDLRRLVDVDEARLAEMLESDIDRLMRGQLRTRMAERWAGTVGITGEVAGVRLLQSDHTDAGSLAFRMTPPDGSRKIWSDAQEFIPVATSFPLDVDFKDDYAEWTVLAGELIIKSPVGTHIVRNLPSEFLVDGTTTNATYLQFDGEPLWSTQYAFSLGYPIFTRLKWIDSVTGDHEEQNVFDNLYGTQLEGTAKPAFSITASDTLGHATRMTLTLTDVVGYASADRLMVSFWVHAPRNTTGTEYVSNYGLAEIPDEVHAIYKNPTGVQEEVNVGVLAVTVRTAVAASANVVITSADVLAASGTSGTTATIVGFDRATIAYDTVPGATFVSATLDTPQTTLTITYSGALTANVNVDTVVYYKTDLVDSWVEVGRGGKSVRAYYDWFEDDVDLGDVPASSYASDLLTGVWSFAEVAGSMLEMPVVWESATGTSGPWTYVVPAASPFAGYQYSNMVSLSVSASISSRYIKVVVPRWQPPARAASDEWIIHYSSTPYQGLSSTGGAVAVAGTAVPKLKKMLHGTIEANSQHVATQSGACSIFGGVNSWTGAQFRFPQQDLNFGGGRFRNYNQTQLVKSTRANGTIDLTGSDPQAMYAAAVMRLPYPANPAMLEGGLYPKSVMDWDLDPGRQGVGSGYCCVAPGYPNDLSRLHSNGWHYDQFVNGLTPFSAGSGIHQDSSVLVPAAALRMDNSSSGTIEYDATTHSWVFQASEDVIGDIPITSSKGMVPLLVTTKLSGLFAGDVPTSFGVDFYSPIGLIAVGPTTWFSGQMLEYNSPVTLDGSNPVIACVVPGSAALYHRFGSLDAYPSMRIDIQATSDTGDRYIGQTFVIQDGPQEHVPSPAGLAFDSSRAVDTVYLPFGSSSSRYSTTAEPDSVAAASLRGRVIQYPDSWGVATATALEALIIPSQIFRSNYGRGMYLGTSTTMHTMPMMVPGSGSPVYSVIQANDVLMEKTAQPAEQYPVSSAVSPFAHSVRDNTKYDHGGPIGYSCYGVIIAPADDDYAGQAVLQISGGPTGPRAYLGSSIPVAISGQPDGTAIDSFWPSKRPLLRSK